MAIYMPACFGQVQPKKWTIRLFFLVFWWWFAVTWVTGRFGQDPFRPGKTWTFRPNAWTIRPRMMNVSAKKDGRFGQIYIIVLQRQMTHTIENSHLHKLCCMSFVTMAAASRVAEDRHQFRREIKAAISPFWLRRQ